MTRWLDKLQHSLEEERRQRDPSRPAGFREATRQRDRISSPETARYPTG
jgi:hypothetical protein